MTLTVTHAKNVSIADDPKAAAAGEVLPSDWNANHTVTGVALQQATGNLTFFVSTTGSDSSDGLTALTAFRTIQHGILTALGFDYQGIYTVTINVADGTYAENVKLGTSVFNGTATGNSPNASLIGNVTTPTNCKIAPTAGPDAPCLAVNCDFWLCDGFSLVNNGTIGDGLFSAIHGFAFMGNMDFNFGTGFTNGAPAINLETYARWRGSSGSGTGEITFQGDGSQTGAIINLLYYTRFGTNGGAMTFNSTINLAGGFFAIAQRYSTVVLGGGGAINNPTKITGGSPLQLSQFSSCEFGSDPATVTLPGGAFDPNQVDRDSEIDGNFYAKQKAGLPANTDLYQGQWGFFKDTSGGGVYAVYNDAGTIKKVALT